jgi:hypothetical protein
MICNILYELRYAQAREPRRPLDLAEARVSNGWSVIHNQNVVLADGEVGVSQVGAGRQISAATKALSTRKIRSIWARGHRNSPWMMTLTGWLGFQCEFHRLSGSSTLISSPYSCVRRVYRKNLILGWGQRYGFSMHDVELKAFFSSSVWAVCDGKFVALIGWRLCNVANCGGRNLISYRVTRWSLVDDLRQLAIYEPLALINKSFLSCIFKTCQRSSVFFSWVFDWQLVMMDRNCALIAWTTAKALQLVFSAVLINMDTMKLAHDQHSIKRSECNETISRICHSPLC